MTTASHPHTPILSRLRNRLGIRSMRTYLTLRRKLCGRPFWIDNGYLQLPFHGDGDQQELLYQLHGRFWWEYESHLLAPYIQPGSVVIDVGANLGFMSAIFSSLAGDAGRVYSFEPSPTVYAKLLEVIRMNGCTNVCANNMGCGREEQSLTLYSPLTSGCATLRPEENLEREAMKKQSVRIVKLDDFLGPELDRLNFIKIDTEGFEDEVLGGAVELLQRFKPVVYIELCADRLESSRNAVHILREQGYTFARELSYETVSTPENYIALPAGFSR